MPILHHPVPYEVLQRRLDGAALVEIRGECRPSTRKLVVEVSAADGGANPSPPGGPWAILPGGDGNFSGRIPLPGGWYRLKVTEFTDAGGAGESAEAGPFGVGEVFLIWGHSIAAGDENGIEGAADPRVTAPADQNDEADVERLAFRFQHLGDGMPIGPFQGYPAQWARLGDRLTRRLQIPVAFYGAAFGGSNIEQNYRAVTRQPFEHSFVRYDLGMPYQAVRAAMNVYAKKTGLRAVLAQHGVNDSGRPGEAFYREFRFLIGHTREEFGMPGLPFVLVNDEVPGGWFQSQRDALRQLFELPGVYRGFDFGRIVETTEGRSDRVHLKLKEDFALYAALMDESLSDAFFRKAAPILPESTAPLAADIGATGASPDRAG